MNTPFTALMRDFGQSIDLPTLEPDEDGCYYLMFDDLAIGIQLMEPVPERLNDDRLLFHACVGILPLAEREAFCLRLLNANLRFAGTDGATLAVDAETGLVMLQRSEPLTDLPAFLHILESFVNQTEGWTACCAKPQGKTSPPEDQMTGYALNAEAMDRV